jgi:hypothetical protein
VVHRFDVDSMNQGRIPVFADRRRRRCGERSTTMSASARIRVEAQVKPPALLADT